MSDSRNWLDIRWWIAGILLTGFLIIPAHALSDGMAFYYDQNSSTEPLEVNEQRAVIAYKDGIQRMFIAINLGGPPSAKDRSHAAVWIFPVPGNPDRADVNIAPIVPKLNGPSVRDLIYSALRECRLIFEATQPHLLLLTLATRGQAFVGSFSGDVIPHKMVDKWGVHAELVTAESVQGLCDYLQKKSVAVDKETLSVFEPYLTEEYVLVLAWIRSYEELISHFPLYRGKQMQRRPSLYVEFPTDTLFYPMRPTS